jgi:hypothetical protein
MESCRVEEPAQHIFHRSLLKNLAVNNNSLFSEFPQLKFSFETNGGHAKLTSTYNFTLRNRSALLTTESELKLIAAPAIIGLSNKPITGYKIPAAIGTPNAL